jgi:L-cysteate sulfo-lyase
MIDLRDKLATFPRQRNSILPTPCYRLDRLSDKLGIDLWCKRDDLTGFGFGGNKTRKLDYLMAEALFQGADTILAVGGIQSNFCRQAAAYAAANKLPVHLVIGGPEPSVPSGNLILDRILGAVSHHIDEDEWDAWEEAGGILQIQLEEQGWKVYRMPVGGSTPTGALGYVEAMAEIIEDERRLGLSFDTIIHATSSAGTQAGLLAGKGLSGWPGRIVGMSAAKEKRTMEAEVLKLARETAALLGGGVKMEDVVVDDAYLGSAYAAHTAGAAEAIELFARAEGIFLDRVYTGKAAAGLVDWARRRRFVPREKVLFIHTGGLPELFA